MTQTIKITGIDDFQITFDYYGGELLYNYDKRWNELTDQQQQEVEDWINSNYDTHKKEWITECLHESKD